jgi:3-hydroxyisobutyrate dehydrogenase-like beta-hydroxyacid dehydrogenase
MGEAFVGNLLADGLEVKVFDRDQERGRAMRAHGAVPVDDLAGLGSCPVVVTSLPNDDALTQVTLGDGGLVDTLAAGAIQISMSPVSPIYAGAWPRAHPAAGQEFVAAPVFGNPDLASARGFILVASGNAPATARIGNLLDRPGQRTVLFGDDPGAAPLMMLGGNVFTALTLQSMGEALALLCKSGIDGRAGFEVLTNSLFDGKVHKADGGKIVEQRYRPPGMTTPLAVKDLRLALAEAEKNLVPMPAAGLVHDRLLAVTARGWSDLDWSALGPLAAAEAGLEDGSLHEPRAS